MGLVRYAIATSACENLDEIPHAYRSREYLLLCGESKTSASDEVQDGAESLYQAGRWVSMKSTGPAPLSNISFVHNRSRKDTRNADPPRAKVRITPWGPRFPHVPALTQKGCNARKNFWPLVLGQQA